MWQKVCFMEFDDFSSYISSKILHFLNLNFVGKILFYGFHPGLLINLKRLAQPLASFNKDDLFQVVHGQLMLFD